MNCSSESTVQNNSYKLSNSQLAKQNAVIYDLQHRDANHFRKKSEVSYNFFLNKHSSVFNPKSCKSNNISFQNNESLNSSVRKNQQDKKLSKLEKYFKNYGNPGSTGNISIPDKNAIKSTIIPKNSFVQGSMYEQIGRNLASSPKSIKERTSFKYSSSMSNSKLMISKQKCQSISKSHVNFENVDLGPMFIIEDILYKFMISVHKEADLYNIFKIYIEYVQDHNFEVFIKLVNQSDLSEIFKNSFILERMALMISFYLSLNGLYKKEIVFLKKIAVLVYSNLILFLKTVFKDCSKGMIAVL
jgi:hypothetical protein